jgi:hypothetical protein
LLAKPTPRNINFGSDRFAMFNKQVGHPGDDIIVAHYRPRAVPGTINDDVFSHFCEVDFALKMPHSKTVRAGYERGLARPPPPLRAAAGEVVTSDSLQVVVMG